MGLFSKKEPVPEIPKAATLPELPNLPKKEGKKDLPELPSFPASSKNETFNQEMVKSAVADTQPSEEDGAIPDVPKSIPEPRMISENDSFSPPPLEFPSMRPEIKPAIPAFPSMQPQTQPQPVRYSSPDKSKEPIFVRIDKFQDSQKNFNNIKEKVNEIESVLRKIKEVKAKEELELKSWTEDVEKIKTKLAEIDVNIFGQL